MKIRDMVVERLRRGTTVCCIAHPLDFSTNQYLDENTYSRIFFFKGDENMISSTKRLLR
jgi:hypothetical protein